MSIASISQYPSFSSPQAAEKAWEDAALLTKAECFAAAIPIFTRLAEDGYPRAAYVIGNLFERGSNDVPVDLEKAEYWYERAASEFVDPDTSFDFARIILKRCRARTAITGDSRIQHALNLLDQLVQSGSGYAAMYLGALYLEGEIVPRDLDRAEYFSKRAADHGYVAAVLDLSRIARSRGSYLRSLWLRTVAAVTAILIAIKNKNDKRLVLVSRDMPERPEILRKVTNA